MVDDRGRRRRDPGVPFELLTPVLEDQLASLHVRGVGPLLTEGVLDLEEVGEIARGVEPQGEVDRFLFLVEDRKDLDAAAKVWPGRRRQRRIAAG